MTPGSRYGLAAAVLLGGAAMVIAPQFFGNAALEDLAKRSRASLIDLEGGRFTAGNYDHPPNSAVSGLVANPENARPPHEVTLPKFALQAYEASWTDLNIFLQSQGLDTRTPLDLRGQPATSAHAAAMDWQLASDYCAWLGGVIGRQMRLPTEDEWEFAARAGSDTPPWATEGGDYRPGQNLPPESYDDPLRDPPIGQFPPSAPGFYDMAAGQREWVSDRNASDPENARILKGGNNISDLAYETIPTRMVVLPAPPELIDLLKSRGEPVPDAPFYPGGGTRCASDPS